MIDIDKLVVSLLQWPHVHINRDDVLEALKDQDIEYCNGELLNHSLSNKSLQNTENTKPKFKVGDTIRSKKYGNKYIKTIKEILNDAYLFTDEKVLSFEFEDKWELVQAESTFEKKKQTGDKIIFSDSLECQVNMSQLERIANKGFEKELDACSKRFPEVSFAKMSRIAKRFYDLGRNSVLDKEKELAYKTQDEVQYQSGYRRAIEDSIEFFYKQLHDGSIECGNIEEFIDNFRKMKGE